MHVMMTQEQFNVLKQKAGGGVKSKGNGKEGDEKLPKLSLKEDDDTHGTIDTDDVLVNYFYNSQEGRLYFSVSKRHSLAAYCASDNIVGTFILDILSAMPNPTKSKESGAGASGTSGEEQEKKDQSHQEQPSQ